MLVGNGLLPLSKLSYWFFSSIHPIPIIICVFHFIIHFLFFISLHPCPCLKHLWLFVLIKGHRSNTFSLHRLELEMWAFSEYTVLSVFQSRQNSVFALRLTFCLRTSMLMQYLLLFRCSLPAQSCWLKCSSNHIDGRGVLALHTTVITYILLNWDEPSWGVRTNTDCLWVMA